MTRLELDQTNDPRANGGHSGTFESVLSSPSPTSSGRGPASSGGGAGQPNSIPGSLTLGSGVRPKVSGRSAILGRRIESSRAAVEGLVITLAIPLIGWVVDHNDPFFLGGHFPWLALAPLLIALRHGFMLGFGSAVLLDVALVLAWRLQFVPVSRFPGEPLVGLIVVAMIAGQFSDLWQREIATLEIGFQGLRRQSNELARAHFLLEVSHDRLDDKVERSRSTLREAMSALREAMSAATTVSFAVQGNTMLEIFATHCGLEVAELVSVSDGTLGDRCAVLGRPEAMTSDDPLLVHALRTGQLTYIPAATRPDRSRNFAKSPLLAAIPFVDSSGEIAAVLCVQAMPFISFEKRNLETMATLGGHFADVVRATRAKNEVGASDSVPPLGLAGGAERR